MSEESPPQPTPEQIRKYMRDNFFADTIVINDDTRKVLEEYSKIPADEVQQHVLDIREKAFAVYPYPCIGMGRFLDLAVGNHAVYAEVITRVRDQGQTFLDLGCAFGQDIRRLVADGAPSERCYGADLRLDFIDLGYELFRDKASLKTRFIAADIFDPSSALRELDGAVDIVNASSFFHLFDYEQQKAAARRVVQLLKPRTDSMLVGRQMGQTQAGVWARFAAVTQRFRHSERSWREFWAEVARETGTELRVEVTSAPFTGLAREGDEWHVSEREDSIRLEYSVRRL